MQRLEPSHPGEGQLIIGPVSFGDDGDLVFAGALERPIVGSGDILYHRQRVVFGIDSAFEERHAVPTLALACVDTHASDGACLGTPQRTSISGAIHGWADR